MIVMILGIGEKSWCFTRHRHISTENDGTDYMVSYALKNGLPIITLAGRKKEMNRKRAERALKAVAARDGVTVEYVRAEIQNAIDIGMANPDLHIRAYWKAIPHHGERPTPEDVISFMAEDVTKKLWIQHEIAKLKFNSNKH